MKHIEKARESERMAARKHEGGRKNDAEQAESGPVYQSAHTKEKDRYRGYRHVSWDDKIIGTPQSPLK